MSCGLSWVVAVRVFNKISCSVIAYKWEFLAWKMWTPSVLANFISSNSKNGSESGNSSATESFKYAAIAGDLKGSFYLPLDIDDTITCFCRWVEYVEGCVTSRETYSLEILLKRSFFISECMQFRKILIRFHSIDDSSCYSVVLVQLRDLTIVTSTFGCCFGRRVDAGI